MGKRLSLKGGKNPRGGKTPSKDVGSRRGRSNRGLTRGSGGLATSLLRAIGESQENRKASMREVDDAEVAGDVYEYEEDVPEEERGKNKRFDDVERYEYELPSDFEDEEIEEEAAFGDDEDDASLQQTGKSRRKEVDLHSDEELEEDVSPAEDDKAFEKESMSVGSSGSEEEEEDEDEEDDEEDDVKYRKMIEAVTGNSASDILDKPSKRKKDRVYRESYPESEFNVNPMPGKMNGNITVEDLMAPLHDRAGFGTIRKRMEQLQKRNAPVEPPLPKILQERLNRKAGYEKTTEDITKWQPLVKSNREALFLVFNKPERAPPASTASLAATFKPTNEFEKEVQALLRQSNLAQVQDVEAAEALELNKLTVDEVRKRQERLAKMRSLLFRHEAKAKRVKKIKSKTYHRLLQKDQKSKRENDAAVAEVDPEGAKAASLEREFKRAQERMTLKHKNNSRWAKRILKRGLKAAENDGTRDAVAEQLRTHAELTRKIQSGSPSGSDRSDLDSDGDDASSDHDEGNVVTGLVLEGTPRLKTLAKAKMATLKALEEGNNEDVPATGLFKLPFMARAIEKKKKAAQDEAAALLEQLEKVEQDGDVLVLDDDYSGNQAGPVESEAISGRMSFGESKQRNGLIERREAGSDSDNAVDEDSGPEFAEDLAPNGGDFAVMGSKSSAQHRKKVSFRPDQILGEAKRITVEEQAQAEIHPMVGNFGKGSFSSQSIETIPAMEVAIAGVPKSQQQPPPSNDLNVAGTPSPTAGGTSEQIADQLPQRTFSDFGDDSDGDDEGNDLLDANSSQQALIRQAFAGDDVEAEFEKVKAQALDVEVPQGEGTASLPGWGQWTHVQRKHGQPAWLVKEQRDLESKRANALKKRKDANLKHVIISERMDKKAAAFNSLSVPFPFTSKEVFESSIRLPIGRDYNTDKAYRNMIRPAVMKSAGLIIDPIKFEEPKTLKKEKSAPSEKRKAPAAHVSRKRSSVRATKRNRR